MLGAKHEFALKEGDLHWIQEVGWAAYQYWWVGCLSILVGGLKAVVSNSFSVAMSTASFPPWVSVVSMERSDWINLHFHVACVAQMGVSSLILNKDSIALLFHHFVG